MIDPVTAAGLGASVIQFTQLAIQLISTGREISAAAYGATIENIDIETAAQNLIDLNSLIQQHNADMVESRSAYSQMSQTELILEQTGTTCDDLAKESLDALSRLKLHDNKGKWKTIIQALKTVWSQGLIDNLHARLERARSAMHTVLLVAIKENVDKITPSILQETKSSATITDQLKAEILQAVRETNSGVLRVPDFEQFSARLKTASRIDKNAFLQAQIVAHLSFQEQGDREYRIVKAYSQTFQWIFSHPETQGKRKWSDFVSFLQNDEDHLYWMTGKPGSGKSTLMKFLLHDPQCIEHLNVWADGEPLILARFYFWNSGTENQMSQERLLKSLLQDALTQRPELTAKLFPQRWLRSQLFGGDMRGMTASELYRAFEILVSSSTDNYKLCIFIDGLDEFEGDHEMLIEMLKSAVSQPNVKACLSSGPWPVFEEGFVHRPNLMLQNLTYPDIMRYTRERFENNSGFMALQRREPEFAMTLITNIVNKACGVFLWVTLTIKSLLAGLSNRDRLSDLQRRLDNIPADLENFFEKIFNSIEPFYQEHACQLFRIVQEAHGTLTALDLSFIDEDDDQLAITAKVMPITHEEEEDRYHEIKLRLNGHCKGLLEIPDVDYYYVEQTPLDKNPTAASSAPNITTPQTSNISIDDGSHHSDIPMDDIPIAQLHQHDTSSEISTSRPITSYTTHESIKKTLNEDRLKPLIYCKVSYLHRTVKDFLESLSIQKQIISQSGSFVPSFSLLRGNILAIKRWNYHPVFNKDIWAYIFNCLAYAEEAEGLRKPQNELLDILDQAVTDLKHNCPSLFPSISEASHWSVSRPSGTATSESGFLDLLAPYRFYSYILPKALQNITIFPDQSQRPLLLYVVADYITYPTLCELTSVSTIEAIPNYTLIQYLLQQGTNPNASYNGQTIWELVLQNCVRIKNIGKKLSSKAIQEELVPLLQYWSEIVEIFIQHEADPRMNRNSQQGSCIREAFSTHLQARSKILEKLISQTSRRWSAVRRFVPPPLKVCETSPEDIIPITKRKRWESVNGGHTNWSSWYSSSILGDPGRKKQKSRVYDSRNNDSSRDCENVWVADYSGGPGPPKYYLPERDNIPSWDSHMIKSSSITRPGSPSPRSPSLGPLSFGSPSPSSPILCSPCPGSPSTHLPDTEDNS